ncbi:MAG: hypothetical protein WBF06_09915 [Candidatus Acidiferrales bacterium]
MISRILKMSAIGLFAMALMVPTASAQRFGGGFRGGFRGGFGGGFYGPSIGFGFYGPGWFYGPGLYWGPYGYGYYGYRGDGAYTGTGHVKLDMQAKDALVYVDGGYAGLSGKLKNFPLKAGAHDIELRDPSGHTFYQERVNVLPGRTVDIEPGTATAPPSK